MSVLAWWRDESKRDEHWLNLGGEQSNDVFEIAEELRISPWLDDGLSGFQEPGDDDREQEDWDVSDDDDIPDPHDNCYYCWVNRVNDYGLEWPEERGVCDEYWTFGAIP